MLGHKEHTLTRAIAVTLAGAITAVTVWPAVLRLAPGPPAVATAAPGHASSVAPPYPAFRIEDALSR
jgi:hypothetical protein